MKDLKHELQSTFEITDLGEPSKIVGIEIDRNQTNNTLVISQKPFLGMILQKQGMADANSMGMPMDPNIKLNSSEGESKGYQQGNCPKGFASNYQQENFSKSFASLIGSLMYLAVATRPDIAYAVYRLGSFMANPNMSHWTAAKHILHYLSGTKEYGITYRVNRPEPGENHFPGYSDASYANNDDLTLSQGMYFL